MVKLIIEIKENKEIKLNDHNVVAVDTQVGVSEVGINATKNEISISKILKKRLRTDEKIQIENESRHNTNELIKEFIDEIL